MKFTQLPNKMDEETRARRERRFAEIERKRSQAARQIGRELYSSPAATSSSSSPFLRYASPIAPISSQVGKKRFKDLDLGIDDDLDDDLEDYGSSFAKYKPPSGAVHPYDAFSQALVPYTPSSSMPAPSSSSSSSSSSSTLDAFFYNFCF